MQDNFNTAAGWVLFSGIVALGLSSVFGRVFDVEQPEAMGYPVVVEGGESSGDSGPDLATLLAAADPARGETAAAARCGTCHSFDAGGADGQGPNLHGVMGRAIAGKAGFGYSGDLSAKGGNWTWEAMDAWILNPRGFAAGTSMGFAGLKNDEQRADILAYLNSLGSNLPLPAPAAAPDAGDAEGDAEGDEASAEEGATGEEAGAEGAAENGAGAEATQDAATAENEGAA